MREIYFDSFKPVLQVRPQSNGSNKEDVIKINGASIVLGAKLMARLGATRESPAISVMLSYSQPLRAIRIQKVLRKPGSLRFRVVAAGHALRGCKPEFMSAAGWTRGIYLPHPENPDVYVLNIEYK